MVSDEKGRLLVRASAILKFVQPFKFGDNPQTRRRICYSMDENTLLMFPYKIGNWKNLYRFVKLIATNHQISINEQLIEPEPFMNHLIGFTTTNADSYVYSINPALAIIINNYYFTSAKKVRHGSEEDMCRVMKVLKCAQIPFIILQDCTHGKYLEILEYIQHCNFHPIKTFILFLMSHGNQGHIIYTRDGQLHLFENIIKPIEANESLSKVQKLFVGNFCRGPIDYEYATYRQLEEINEHFRNVDLKKIKSPNCCQLLSENSTFMFSVPDGVQSPRDPQSGSPYMEIFCQIFPSIDHNKDFREVYNFYLF
ncbi:caspase-3-like [Musca autumnalis]|uniref:caspase-3-like n=1 Tax=Musca autumnalis TaxID=221902 RepID=UPI003CF8FF5F